MRCRIEMKRKPKIKLSKEAKESGITEKHVKKLAEFLRKIASKDGK
jgi:hypothetical protein